MENSSFENKPNYIKIVQLYEEVSATCAKFADIMEKFNSSSRKNKRLDILEVKIDAMLSYIINLSYLMLKKCCGQSVYEIDIRERLVELRVILERIKPLEDKLKYQIEKMIKATTTGESDSMDKSNFRANIANLNSDVSDEEDNDEDTSMDKKDNELKPKQESGIYKPPKVAAVPYDDDSKAEKQRKLLESAKRRALNSSIIQELKDEYLDTPLEISNPTTLRNVQSKYKKEKESYEETYFTRLPITKKEKQRDKLMSSLTLGTLGNEVTRFEDISALEGRLPDSNKKRKKSLTKKKKKGFKKRRTL